MFEHYYYYNKLLLLANFTLLVLVLGWVYVPTACIVIHLHIMLSCYIIFYVLHRTWAFTATLRRRHGLCKCIFIPSSCRSTSVVHHIYESIDALRYAFCLSFACKKIREQTTGKNIFAEERVWSEYKKMSLWYNRKCIWIVHWNELNPQQTTG